MSARRTAVIVSISSVALVLCAGSCGTRMVLERRADDFAAQCRALLGADYTEALERFPDMPAGEADIGGVKHELTIVYRYGLAGFEACKLEMRGGRAVSAQAVRGNDFDSCADPISYPRRHWLCSALRVVVP